MSSLAPPPHDNKRQRLSLAEEVWSIPYLSQRSVMSFLQQDEAVALRAASRACRDAIAEHAWEDIDVGHYNSRSCIHGSHLAAWRRCVPHARAANISENTTIADADFVHLKGVHNLNMRGCTHPAITDSAFENLKGIHTLNMLGCNQPTITDVALSHLVGVKEVQIGESKQFTSQAVAIIFLYFCSRRSGGGPPPSASSACHFSAAQLDGRRRRRRRAEFHQQSGDPAEQPGQAIRGEAAVP